VDRAVTLIVNPQAGGGRAAKALPTVEATLRRLGVDVHIEATASLDHAAELARVAAAAGEAVAVLSGDGLIGKVAGELSGTDSPLAVLPGGRGNDLAGALDIPGDPEAACRVVADGRIRELDLGEVDGRAFIGIASCGFDSEANRIANEAKLVRGNLVYAYAALKALAGWKAARFEVVIDGERHEVTGYSVGACNSKAYGGGMIPAPEAVLDDGELDVVLCADMSKWRFLRSVLPKLFKGNLPDEPNITYFKGKTIDVRADRPFVMYADGDPLADLPATVRVSPRSLRVIVPRD